MEGHARSEGTGWDGNSSTGRKQKERIVQPLLLSTEGWGKQGEEEEEEEEQTKPWNTVLITKYDHYSLNKS